MPKTMEYHEKEELASEIMAPEGKARKGHGEIDRINIESADNGYIVTCYYKPPRRKQDEPIPVISNEVRKVFADYEDVAAFVKKVLSNPGHSKSGGY